MAKRFSSHDKIFCVLAVLRDKKSVTSVCKEFGIARKTFYQWLRKYQSGEKTKRPHREATLKASPHIVNSVLRIIVSHPEYGTRKISEELGKKSIQIGNHGVQNILQRLSLRTASQRNELSQRKQALKKGHLLAQERLVLMEYASRRTIPMSRLCHLLGVSRKTFYKWLRKYEKDASLQALFDQVRRIPEHPFKASPAVEEKVLDVVISNAQLSTHKIVEMLPKTADGKPMLGNHGVQNVLKRFDLNTFEKRQAYALTHAPKELILPVPSQEVVPIQKPFLPQAPLHGPPLQLVLQGARAFARTAFLSRKHFLLLLFSSLGTLFLFYNYLLMLARAEPGTHLGLFFASIALLFGLFFFLYSIKYYLVIASVLGYSKEFPHENAPRKEGISQKIVHAIASFLGASNGSTPVTEGVERVGLVANIEQQKLDYFPFVSIHVATYNEKRVVNRLLTACTGQDYPNYEVVVADDSTDETVDILEQWKLHPRVRISHRPTRQGFKGGALGYALEKTDPKAEFVIILDADFIPYPDTITQFLKYFKASTGRLEKFQDYYDTKIAAVQGYQWHVLNKSENWVTRGVRSEFAGSYVMERSGNEIFGGLKMIAGSVYMIRRDVLQAFGWGTSITEDFELTLKIYEAGYKVVYTPYVQAPSECVSTVKRLIRQRMRWAEGHSFNVKKMFSRLMGSPYMNWSEKLEFLYLSPYYLQSLFFIIGTLSWFLSETVFHAKLPFWTALWGWSLVFSNMLSLPLMNSVGLFLEEAEEKDYLGLFSFIAMSYLLVPFQAYAAVRGFLEKEEGGWFRTPKSGKITDTITRGQFYRWLRGIFPWKKQPAFEPLEKEPSLAFNFYLARQTAHNSFESFRIRRRGARYLSKVVFIVLLSLSVQLNYIAFFTNPFLDKVNQFLADQGTNIGTSTVSAAEKSDVEDLIYEGKIDDTVSIVRTAETDDLEYEAKLLSSVEVKFHNKVEQKAQVEIRDNETQTTVAFSVPDDQFPLQTVAAEPQDGTTSQPPENMQRSESSSLEATESADLKEATMSALTTPQQEAEKAVVVPDPVIEGNQVTYDIKGGRLRWTVSENQVKEEIVWVTKPEKPEVVMNIEAENVNFVANGNGSFSAMNGGVSPIFTIPAPIVKDSQGKAG
ncbi:MAG TPA: glycosyltransferase, partial [Patescibacteria group bacterium]|nr:glycosyltransferase [Patescibacteria group bacterium]